MFRWLPSLQGFFFFAKSGKDTVEGFVRRSLFFGAHFLFFACVGALYERKEKEKKVKVRQETVFFLFGNHNNR